MAHQNSIPIIELRKILIVSIQTSLSDRLVMQLKEEITAKITRTNARGLIIDLTGIDIMDSFISKAIRDISLIAHLMGVRTLISGMDSMIAMTLIEMGMELESVETALNLDVAVDILEGETNESETQADLMISEFLDS